MKKKERGKVGKEISEVIREILTSISEISYKEKKKDFNWSNCELY